MPSQNYYIVDAILSVLELITKNLKEKMKMGEANIINEYYGIVYKQILSLTMIEDLKCIMLQMLQEEYQLTLQYLNQRTKKQNLILNSTIVLQPLSQENHNEYNCIIRTFFLLRYSLPLLTDCSLNKAEDFLSLPIPKYSASELSYTKLIQENTQLTFCNEYKNDILLIR